MEMNPRKLRDLLREKIRVRFVFITEVLWTYSCRRRWLEQVGNKSASQRKSTGRGNRLDLTMIQKKAPKTNCVFGDLT